MNALNRNGARARTLLLVSGAALAISLALVLGNLFSSGHAAFNTASNGVTWGLPVVNYVFFALTCTGLGMVASLALVFGARPLYPIAKRCLWVSMACILAAFVSLAMELGHPFRMLWAIPLNFQYQSPLLWMGLFYAVFLVLGGLKFLKLHRGDWDSSGSRALGLAALAAEVLAALTLGSAFGMMAMRPIWYGAEVPVNFLVTGATSGAALAVLVTYMAYGGATAMPERVRSAVGGWMPMVQAGTVALFLLMVAYRSINGLWTNADGMQVWSAIVRTPWYWVELGGLAVAFTLLIGKGTRSKASFQVAAALLTLLAVFISRYEFVVGGQLVPLFKGTWVPGLIDYAPSTTEWMITLMAVSMTFFVYAWGELKLDLAAAPSVQAGTERSAINVRPGRAVRDPLMTDVAAAAGQPGAAGFDVRAGGPV